MQVKIKFNVVFLIICIVFFLFRLLAFIQTNPGFDIYDSPSYFNPTWTSPTRMPLISYLFTYLGYFGAINLVQTFIGIGSWIFLAYSIANLTPNFGLKIFASIITFSLGVSSPIVAFDSIILSESLTISIFNLVVGFILLFFHNSTILRILGISISLIIYSGLKQTNAHLSLIVVIFILFFVIIEYHKDTRFKSFLFVISSALILNIFFIWIARQNDEINSNVEVTNIIERSFDTYESQNWWLDRGFPGIAYQAYSSPPYQPPIDTTRALPQVKAWEIFEKNSPIELFAMSHLDYLVLAPILPRYFIPHFTDFESIYSPLSRGYRMDQNRLMTNLVSGKVEPFFLENLNLPATIWWQTESGESKFLFLILLLPIILYTYKSTRKGGVINPGVARSVFLLVSFTLMAIWANWHISVNYEMARYLMPWAIVLRILFIICTIALIDNLRKQEISS